MLLDWNLIILALIAGAPTTLVAFGGLLKILLELRKTHSLVNSRMTELLELARGEATATAILNEKQAEQNRQDAKEGE